jgi:hypothetical protein
MKPWWGPIHPQKLLGFGDFIGIKSSVKYFCHLMKFPKFKYFLD